MNKTIHRIKGLMALLLSLATILATGLSLFAFAEDGKADEETESYVVQTVIVRQTVTGTPTRDTYSYVLTPRKPDNPMPEGTVNGVYTVPAIAGSKDAPAFTMTISKEKPGVFEYVLERVEAVPKGDTVSPEKHIFGYKVRQVLGPDGIYRTEVLPYICDSDDPDIEATKIILKNFIQGPPPSTKSTSISTRTVTIPTTKKTPVPTTRASRAPWVNTGDNSHLLFWAAVVGISAVGILVLILIRRNRDDDEESV